MWRPHLLILSLHCQRAFWSSSKKPEALLFEWSQLPFTTKLLFKRRALSFLILNHFRSLRRSIVGRFPFIQLVLSKKSTKDRPLRRSIVRRFPFIPFKEVHCREVPFIQLVLSKKSTKDRPLRSSIVRRFPFIPFKEVHFPFIPFKEVHCRKVPLYPLSKVNKRPTTSDLLRWSQLSFSLPLSIEPVSWSWSAPGRVYSTSED